MKFMWNGHIFLRALDFLGTFKNISMSTYQKISNLSDFFATIYSTEHYFQIQISWLLGSNSFSNYF